MADESNVLYVRDNGNDTSDSTHDSVWDDTTLIKAYDKAINLAKEEVAKRIEMQTSHVKQKSQNLIQNQHLNKSYNKWIVGSPCRAVYSEDGEIYEAFIKKIFENSGTCIVKFIGYGNTEKVELSSLLESQGLQSQTAQKEEAMAEKCDSDSAKHDGATFCIRPDSDKFNGIIGEKMDCNSDETRPFKHFFMPGPSFASATDTIPPAPPLPPQLMAKLPENDADALSSMLMSWYMSGFHTGYYHGLKQARCNQEKRRNC
ncbi:hypothetical protein KM043_016197 [Ampulex compressa]|nr:hypothetical protein KM043_016197 [Ampulex compressa]